MFLLKLKNNQQCYHPEPGDILVGGDERAVYVIQKDNSLRRIKDKDQHKQAIAQFRKMKAEAEQRAAEQQVLDNAPLTAVDAKTMNKMLPALAVGAPLPRLAAG